MYISTLIKILDEIREDDGENLSVATLTQRLSIENSDFEEVYTIEL